jgi:hypothetical protein
MNADKSRVRDTVAVGGFETEGRGVEPSKWPQNPFASIASWKRIENAVQFNPVGRSLGTEEGRISVVSATAGPIT